MAAADFFLENWEIFFSAAAGLLATGFSVWFTAKRTVATTVQQKVWQGVYDAKRTEILAFHTLVTQLGACLNSFLSLQKGAKENPLGRLLGVLQNRLRDGPNAQDKALLAEVQKAQLGQSPGFDVRRAYREVRERCIVDLRQIRDDLEASYARLSLSCYDPRPVRNTFTFATNIYNHLGKTGDGYMTVDFPKTFLRFREVNARTRLSLRKDLQRSTKSLRHALEHSKGWEEWMLSPRPDSNDDAMLKPVLLESGKP